MDREKQIVRASIISIAGNGILAVMKAIVGTISGSIAITLDAVNSLTDALASIIAIIGTKLAGRPADREHPFGYGRVEYFASIVIASMILAAGLSAFVEAVKSIMHPSTPDYSIVTLVVVGIAALVKAGLGVFLKRVGKQTHSNSLIGSGADSFMDALVSTATLVAAIVYLVFGVMVESWLAAGIAILICKSGVQLLIDTVSKLLGERMSPKIASQVEREARKVEGVRLANGVVLFDFGPDRVTGSVHVTVDGTMTVAEFDAVARNIQSRVYEKCGIMLTGVTPYAASTHDESAANVRSTIGRIVWGYDHVVELRGLYVDCEAQMARFDAVVEYGVSDFEALRTSIREACEQSYPDWQFELRVIPDAGD